MASCVSVRRGALVASTLALALPVALGAATLPTGFTETQIASGLSNPTAMAVAPDGRVFVCLQGGQLRVIQDGQLLSTPFLTVTVNSAGERGLLGVAFDPDFTSNNFVYVYYTATSPAIHNRVSRFTANGNVAVAGSEQVILELDNLSSATNHNGGALHFGPDGRLYIAVGENANGQNAQVLTNLLGKMLRINKDGTMPQDNPFVSQTSGRNQAIWALGLRNPFTFNFQRSTGRMFINDVGQSTWEEINDGIAGSNYGWPTTEGPTTDPRFRAPLHAYPNDANTCAITGGAFYDPITAQFPPEYVGTYLFADFCGNWIRRFDPDTGAVTDFAAGAPSPVDLQVDDDGALWYLARGTGSVWRVEFTGNEAPRITSHPSSQTVGVGQPASFSVDASGTAPLSYQWQRNGVDFAGATSSTFTLASATSADDGAAFRAVVSNSFGTATSNAATLTVVSSSPPLGTITAPANGTLYTAGTTVGFSGTASDAEDGGLPAAAFTWRVDFHHDDHVHPFMAATSGITSGSFTIPTTGETSANVFYRVVLTVHDSGGLTHTTFSDLVPRTATFTLASNPTGLQLTLDGQPTITPFSVVSVVGVERTLGAPSPQTLGGTNYEWTAWSDGGAATHTVATPATDTSYTASFSPSTSTVPPGAGLLGTYWNNVNFTGTVFTRLDPTVDFDWGTGAPIAGIAADTFSVRWTGQVRAKVSGTHTFYTVSDDGVRLWVNGQLIIDNFTDHAPTENTGTISLTAGQGYDIRMDLYENGGGAVGRLSWSAPGLAREVIPTSHLHPYALLVVGSTTLNTGDAAVRARLEQLGHSIVLRTGVAATSSDAVGKAVVVVSSTVNSSDVNRKFRNVVNAVVCWEPLLFDDLGMTGTTSGTSFGTVSGQTQVTIVNATHPLAAGLSGSVAVTTSAQTFSFGVPNASAVVAARPSSTSTRGFVFGYERSAAMPGLAAPGRRVGLFLQNTTAAALNDSGRNLLDAAIRWAQGR